MKLINAALGLAGLITVACGGAISQQPVASYDPNCRTEHITPEVSRKECSDPRDGRQYIANFVNGQEVNEGVYDANGVLIGVVIFEMDKQGNTIREHRFQSGQRGNIPYLIRSCQQNGSATHCRYQGEGHLFNDPLNRGK